MSYKESYTEQLRENFLKYTRKAFKSLPKMEKPRILDLGCGSGLLSIELANLTDGNITAIDIDQSLLDQLNEKLTERGLLVRIKTKNMNLLKNDFPDNFFDLIWEEGVVQIIGFKKSFEACHRILKVGGYLVLGQAIKGMNKNKDLITRCGFELIEQLNWPENCWWTEFYKPLEDKIKEIHEGKENLTLFEDIDAVLAEIKMVKTKPNDFNCAHYILRKRGNKS
jgi:cyclopropane fatty-acyl-phospholipid synthase-like methyltransferase